MSPTPIFGRVAAVIVAMMLVATACAPSEGAGDTGIATLGDTSATDQASNENGTDTVEAPENVEEAYELFDRCMSDAGFDFETADVGSGGLRVDTFGDVGGVEPDPQESSSSVDDFDPDAFDVASDECSRYLENIDDSFDLTPEEEAAFEDAQLAWSVCMAEQGIDIPELDGDGAIAIEGETDEKDPQPNDSLDDPDFDFAEFEEAATVCERAFAEFDELIGANDEVDR